MCILTSNELSHCCNHLFVRCLVKDIGHRRLSNKHGYVHYEGNHTNIGWIPILEHDVIDRNKRFHPIGLNKKVDSNEHDFRVVINKTTISYIRVCRGDSHRTTVVVFVLSRLLLLFVSPTVVARDK